MGRRTGHERDTGEPASKTFFISTPFSGLCSLETTREKWRVD